MAIELKKVSFSYPNGFEAVHEVDLRIDEGEKVAIVGQNGAGKTTTVKLMNGLNLPSSGDVLVDGINTKDKTCAFMSKYVGYVFQNPDDQIFNSTIPVMGAGLSHQYATMGRVKNWGIEAVLSTVNIRKKDFTWTTNFQFNLNRSILKELDGSGQDNIQDQLFLNKSLGAIYGYDYDRVVQVEDTEYMQANGAKPGDPMYVDHDSDGVITPSDRVILGFNKPSFQLNMGNTITWKDFSLYFLFAGTFSGGKYGVAPNNFAFATNMESMAYINVEDHPFWTEQNRDTKHVGATADVSKFTGVQKYGFIRLQDVNLAYNLKGAWMSKVGLSSAQVYVSGQNLFFIAPDWEFSDPEIRNSRATQLARTVTFGLNVRF